MMSLAEQVAGGGELTAPPDTHAAANATNVVEVVNSTLNVYDRSTGARTGSQIELASLLSPPSGYRVSDPRVIYDAPSHRWIVSAMSFKKPFSLGQIDVVLQRIRDRVALEAENRRLSRQVSQREGVDARTPILARLEAIESRLGRIETLLRDSGDPRDRFR